MPKSLVTPHHQLVPVADAVVPAHIRQCFEIAKPTGSDVSQKKGMDAFFDLMELGKQDRQLVTELIGAFGVYRIKFEPNENMTASQIKRMYEDAREKTENTKTNCSI